MLRCSLLQCRTLRIKFQKTLHACPHATHTDQRIPQIVAAGAAFPGLAFPVLSSLRPDAAQCAGTHDEDRAGAPASVRSDAVARAARASAVRGRRIGDSCLYLSQGCVSCVARVPHLFWARVARHAEGTRAARARARGVSPRSTADAPAGRRGRRARRTRTRSRAALEGVQRRVSESPDLADKPDLDGGARGRERRETVNNV